MTPYRLLIASLLTAGVSVAAGLGAAQSASAAAPCGINSATVVKRSPHAMLVRRGKVRKHFWACLYGGQAVHVGYEDSYEEIGRYAFGGHFFAISSYECLAECGEDVVRVYNLRSRRRVREFSLDGVAKLLVGTRGGVAILSIGGPVIIGEPGEPSVLRVWDSRGMTVAATTPYEVPLTSVRVVRNLLRWTQGGVERSFRMRSWRRQAASSLRTIEREDRASEGIPSIAAYGGLLLATVAIGGLTVGFRRLASRG